ncbi:unnamed protein product [Arctogadus glacialis]
MLPSTWWLGENPELGPSTASNLEAMSLAASPMPHSTLRAGREGPYGRDVDQRSPRAQRRAHHQGQAAIHHLKHMVHVLNRLWLGHAHRLLQAPRAAQVYSYAVHLKPPGPA